MLKLNIIFLTCVIFALCESSSIVGIIGKKCGANDSDCQKDILDKIWPEVADNGIQDLGIPRIDPYEIKDIEVTALGMLSIKIKEGTFEGLKKCHCSSYETSMKTQATVLELTCPELKIEGKYKITPTPTLMQLVGGIQIGGEGSGSLVAEKVKINMVFPYKIKRVNGELYYHMKADEVTSDMQVLGKAVLTADNILVGKQEISATVVKIFNENWNFIIKSFAQIGLDKGMEVAKEIIPKYFDGVAIKDMVTDDLSSYVS